MMNNSNINTYSLTNDGVFQLVGEYIKQIRINKQLTQDMLAEKAGVNRTTIYFFEKGERGNMDTFIRLLRALDKLYFFEQFQLSQDISPLALLKMEKNKPKRASKKR